MAIKHRFLIQSLNPTLTGFVILSSDFFDRYEIEQLSLNPTLTGFVILRGDGLR